jgi:acetyl/propionyl-CoA carboxylase alpha subunit
VILEISDNHQKVMVKIISAGGRRKIRLGDREIQFDWVKLSDGHYSLILDSSVYDLTIDLDADACVVAGHAGMHSFRILDSRHSGIGPHMEDGPSGLRRVCAEMPGKVIRVLVKEGETVAYDQGLLILEAMKMQNEIRAPKSGVIKEIAAAGGTAVSTGEFLLSIE